MSVLINLNTTVNPLSGGTDAAAGLGEEWKITGSGTFHPGDTVTIQLTDNQTGVVTQLGAGNITGLTETFCFTYNNKVYMLAGDTTYFSAIGEPTVFNDPTASGYGFISMSDWFSSPDPLTSIGPYQGKLIFTSRRTTQIWNVDPDPANYSQSQVLPNIGTIAPLSLQPVGDMDVYMMADNGIRSVRVRDASNNAAIADVGTPIDALLQPLLASLTDAQKATACGVVEPTANRYWLYIPKPDGSVGYIWVFSSFGGEIAAWSTYTPSYESGAVVTTFVPIKFVTYQGQVWCLDSTGRVYQFGGSDNNTYSQCGMTVVTPFFDSGKPATNKTYSALDCAFEGTWNVHVSPDYVLQKYKSIYNNTISSFQLQRIPVESQGTHYSMKFVESGTGYARFSSALMHLQMLNEK